MTPRRRRVFVAAAFAVCGAALVVSCGRDATGPGAHLRARLAIAPVFADPASALVDFTRVRVTVVRAAAAIETGGGRTAVDTVIAFPTDADSLELALKVPLDAPTEEFLLYIRLITETGDTVFRNEPYPQRIVVEAARTTAPLDAVLTYVGVGFEAAALVITTADTVVAFGGTVDLAAVALGIDQKPIPGTPIEWASLDPAVATVPDAALGRVTGGTQRGSARIVARTPTGLADTVTVTAQPLPALLAIVAGDGQQALPGGTLALPLRVRVTGADGLGVRAPVHFRAIFPGAFVTDAVVGSDAAGFAETQATLASLVGLQQFEASVQGVSTPAVFTADAVSPVARVIVSPSAPAVLAVLNQTQQFTAQALDAANNPIATTIAWTSSDPAVATVDASGLATAVGNGTATITAKALGVLGSAPVAVLQQVVQLVFATQPSDVVAGVPISPAVTVTALDAGGSVARNFTSAVTLARDDLVACAAILLGTATVPAVAGVATFDAVRLEVACPGLQLRATADTFASSLSDPFTVLAGPAAKIAAVSVTDLTGTVAAILPALTVQVTDQFNNPLSGYDVQWVVTAGAGTFPSATSRTDASGVTSNVWTLGTVAGAQTAEAQAAGLAGSPVKFTATAAPGAPTQLAFVVQPSNVLLGGLITPPVKVAINDQFGNRVPTTDQITLELNPLNATLLGTPSVAAVDGLATFADLGVNLIGLGYTLVATSGTLSQAVSKPFDVSLP